MSSRLGFGTSRLHYLKSSSERQAILSAAYDNGLRWFDTAPSYGHGLAERELAIFLRSKPECTITTKFGWRPDPIISKLPLSVARSGIAARSVITRLMRRAPAREIMTAQSLRQSVETSLRRLGVSHIDHFLLHDPQPDEINLLDEVMEEAAVLLNRGLIRRVGVAGQFTNCRPVMDRFSEMNLLVQIPEADRVDGCEPDVTYSPLSRGQQSFQGQASVTKTLAAERIKAALNASEKGIVLFSTTRVGNLEAVAEASSS